MKGSVTERSAPPRKRGALQVIVPCRLYDDQAEALRLLAERSDIPQATLVRHAVQRFLAEHPDAEFGG